MVPKFEAAANTGIVTYIRNVVLKNQRNLSSFNNAKQSNNLIGDFSKLLAT